ncbi:MAG TPA: winged helix-turn-helix domain-containing protein [Terriglobales bacterium]|jgi:TolB-like protein/DNA-binding winged helix-turn-helix (wHTH) protein
MSATTRSVIRFGVFEVDVRAGELRKSGLRLRLQEQPFQVLVALLERAGELVTREELRDRVWPKGTFVAFDYALNTAVKKIRAALSDDANLPRYIETIPRRGYRFIGTPDTIDATNDVSAPVIEAVNPAHRGLPFYWLVSMAGVLLVGSALIYVGRKFAQNDPPPGRRILLVVLPFENLGASDPAHVCEGLNEELITQAGRLDPSVLGVAAKSSVAAYTNSHKSVADIGRQLQADFVLEGSIRRDGRRFRVSAQLIRTSDQTHVWANEFDGEPNDMLAFQSEVASAISQQMKITLLAANAPGSR